MTWYAAHTIEYLKFMDGIQDFYPIYENILLIEAETVDTARQEATRIAEAESGSECTVNNRPARHTFAGIRKLIECQNTVIADLERGDDPFRPINGTEITYSTFIVESAEAFEQLVNGNDVELLYEG